MAALWWFMCQSSRTGSCLPVDRGRASWYMSSPVSSWTVSLVTLEGGPTATVVPAFQLELCYRFLLSHRRASVAVPFTQCAKSSFAVYSGHKATHWLCKPGNPVGCCIQLPSRRRCFLRDAVKGCAPLVLLLVSRGYSVPQ